ncbi:uncharacterized protein LOC110226370 [Arabidopsis lyrata subsp. lyrata]|uniref:uncharacterized protein LOC110226370 n=1 Tax=Arabidopsis lyrata subsp. lyrata TaxID=81972 RepID=UPI000A29CEA0|nr:uncharacterized protein LOC110226370 [Arabidopsis lyrata subsp. lyrata]|eukprot:XP_020873527.1 uncharacterized protein LOC110226370 [Arabidopsis lyrata subsp. lyrata]
MNSYEKSLWLTFSAIALILVSESYRTKQLEEEENELERLLKNINKPAIKSFRTKHGDTLDCIDIHKQLAFDHSLLINHSIQLRPTTIPKWTISNNNNSEKGGSLPFRQDGISCPLGTVIVKRTTLEDLIQARSLKSMGFKSSRYVSSNGKNIDLSGYHFAVAQYKKFHYGAKGNLNIWEPEVSPNQFSLASITIAAGSNEQFQGIRAGWIVYQWLNKNHSRLYTYWTADGFEKTGCYNTLCPGFVQVSTDIPLGYLLQPVSIYGGKQYEVGINMYKDHITGNWWLVAFNDNYVGYWPKSLFTAVGLGHGGSLASWGGEVYSPVKEKSPRMGSGHFPEKRSYTKVAYMNDFVVYNDLGSVGMTPPLDTLKTFSSTPNCYKVKKDQPLFGKVWDDAIFYGGPGGCTF